MDKIPYRFEYNHLPTSIHPSWCIYCTCTYILTYCIGIVALFLSACMYSSHIPYMLYTNTHMLRCPLVSTHTHIFKHMYAHAPHIDLKWPDWAACKQAIRLDSERWATLSDMTAVIPPSLSHTHTHTHIYIYMGLRSNMTAEIAAFINVWPFPRRCSVLLYPSLPFTVLSH